MSKENAIPVITIDGPGGVGKGTVAMLLAKHLEWHFLDSGLFYRSLAWLVNYRQMDLNDETGIIQLVDNFQLVFNSSYDDTSKHCVIFEGQYYYASLKDEKVALAAAKISVSPSIRASLLDKQRDLLAWPGLIADGRDMGTIVFPEAFLKIFLVANVKERAKRRFKQLQDMGEDVKFDQLLREMQDRDERDKNREVSPLVPAADAVILDSTEMSVKQVAEKISAIMVERGVIEENNRQKLIAGIG